MTAAKQILAHIAEKVQVAGQNGNRKAEVVCQAACRFGYRPAEVAHDGARRAELRRGFFQLRQDGIAPFGGDLPGAQNPTAPAGERYQQCAAAVFAQCAFNSCTSSVDVQRPASIGGQRGTQGRGRIPMKGFQVHDKTLAEFTNFATGKMDSVFLFQRTADFLPLSMADKTFDANIDHDVIADGAFGRNQFGQCWIAPGHQ